MDTRIVRTENGRDYNSFGEEVIDCRNKCGRKTTMTGTGLCDCCWNASITADPARDSLRNSAITADPAHAYKPLRVEVLEIGGLIPSMQAMRLPKGGESDSWYALRKGQVQAFLGPSDADRAGRLTRAGNDHAKAMRGIIVWLKMEMQTGWMIEFETYRHGVECLSTSSSMHGELKELTGPALAEQKQRDLPEKVYTRILHISYQALRSMYRARRKHRHPDWQIFCDFIETLPWFGRLIMPERKEKA